MSCKARDLPPCEVALRAHCTGTKGSEKEHWLMHVKSMQEADPTAAIRELNLLPSLNACFHSDHFMTSFLGSYGEFTLR